MYCKDLLVIVLGLYFCFIGGDALASIPANFQTTQIIEADSFHPFTSLQFSPKIDSQRITQSPSPSPTNKPTDGFPVDMEKCNGIPQVGKREFCLGQALVKYGRLDEAKDHLRAARDRFKENGNPEKAKEVEIWARNNNVQL